jgi:2-polyprenyl-6-methoxyphenol hydroxylase-like FAD-dependent oxidoreductase
MAHSNAQQPETALVIGGSLAGLLAARTLADHFQQVIVFERDVLPEEPLPRKGVPQGRHAHALLPRGQLALEALLPGLTAQLEALGAPRGSSILFHSGGAYHCPIESPLRGVFVSRPALEGAVRAWVLALPNVQLVAANVLSLLSEAGRVTGVRYLRRETGSAEETMHGQMVLDASGRGSRLPAWLEAMGYQRPAIERVVVDMGYATRQYRRSPEHLGGELGLNVTPTAGTPRGGGVLAQEGDRWVVTLAGYHGNYPPSDEAGFVEFARQLPAREVYDLILTATPLDDIASYRFPADERQRYDRLKHFPEGLLVLGDALCSFTPVYGQGMTVAALEVVALQQVMRHHGTADGLARRFFQHSRPAVDAAWAIAAGNDKRLLPMGAPGAEPPHSPAAGLAGRALNWYLDQVQLAARYDPVASLAFRNVGGLLASPASLMQPLLVLRVLGSARRAAHGA